jgi:hypothetical protein
LPPSPKAIAVHMPPFEHRAFPRFTKIISIGPE